MSSTPLGQEYFDQTIERLFAVVATKDELTRLVETTATKHDLARPFSVVATQDDLHDFHQELLALQRDVATLATSVDDFAKDYRKDADERAVLNGRVERIKKVLVAKGVAKEQELAV